MLSTLWYCWNFYVGSSGKKNLNIF